MPLKRRRELIRERTFADIRRDCEQKLARGERLNFDKVMLEIAAIRKRAGKTGKD
jgi:hypothetical protein